MDVLAPVLLALAAGLTTFLGGALALRLRHRLNILMPLTAGIVLGVALLELVPEALRMAMSGAGQASVLFWVSAGAALVWMLDRMLREATRFGAALRPHLAPASLTIHSLVDGAGIGLAFSISEQVGWSVAVAVLSHDFADGVNVVGSSLAAGDRRAARFWLVVNGSAPLAGVALTFLLTIPADFLFVLISALGGAFLYIGASELLPNSYRMDRPVRATVTSALGFGLVFLSSRLI